MDLIATVDLKAVSINFTVKQLPLLCLQFICIYTPLSTFFFKAIVPKYHFSGQTKYFHSVNIIPSVQINALARKLHSPYIKPHLKNGSACHLQQIGSFNARLIQMVALVSHFSSERVINAWKCSRNCKPKGHSNIL